MPWDSPFVFRRFVESALNLRHPSGYEVQWCMGGGWSPARRHIDALEKALAWGADLLVILGADQVYEPDVLERLTARWEQLGVGSIISALVPLRGFIDWQGTLRPFQPLAWRLECDGVRAFRGYDVDGDMMKVVSPADGDLQRAHIVGSGCILFHRDLYLALKPPQFYERVDPETMYRVADQDTRAVWRLQEEAGGTLWVDTTIKVQHLHIFPIDETFQDRFADWADPSTPGIDRTICRFREELPHHGAASSAGRGTPSGASDSSPPAV